MRAPLMLVLAASGLALGLAGCGGTSERTVVIAPPAGSTVVVPEHGAPRVVPPGR